jgi:23S rRNA G2069 N7-methylase RlmK/C1962 C5-methylase RlmI
MALDCLEPGGTILACTNFRGMRSHEFEAQLEKASRQPLKLDSAEMPDDFSESPYLKSIWARR